MNRAGARASCRVAALVCTPPIMWNVWVPECPDSPIAASLQPEPKLNPSRIAGPEDPEPCSVSGEEGCLRAHEGEGLRLERGQEFRMEAGREVGVPEPPREHPRSRGSSS